MKFHTTAACITAALATIPALDAQLILTEIQSDGLSDFWELTNTGTTTINLGGYAWDDDSRQAASGVTIPANTMIAPGESIVFTGENSATFRTQWGIANTVQIVEGGPGFGKNDGVAFFDAGGSELFFFTYAAGGFTKTDGNASTGDHAGISAGGASGQAIVWDASTGSSTPRYTYATGTSLGTFAAAASSTNTGSPGYSGFGVAPPSISLSLSVSAASFRESAGSPASIGTVTRTGSTSAALEVSLTSTDTTEASVPETVIIPAGQASATFEINAIDDIFPDGDKTFDITATATDATLGTIEITVTDDADVFPHNLLLTEILSKQDGSNEDFWELTNIGANPADISGYTWSDSGGSYNETLDKVPSGTILAPGESIVFTSEDPAVFRAFWNMPDGAKIAFTPNAPGLGKNDGVRLFEAGGNEVFFVSYESGAFNRADGTASLGGHSGYSASPDGSDESTYEVRSMVWVPDSNPALYTAADGTNFGTYAPDSLAGEIGSPGNRGLVIPTVSISSAEISEGDSGSKILTLDVTRSHTDTSFTVDYAVTGGTATAGEDFEAISSGSINFTASGAATESIDISVLGDTVGEGDETIILTLSNTVNQLGNTVIAKSQGIGTILNDDQVAPAFSMQASSGAIVSGGNTTLSVVATGFPAPTFQWYLGESGDTSNPIANATGSTFQTPALAGTTRYWVRATSGNFSTDSDTVVVEVVTSPSSVDLSTYVRIGRYDLPEPTRTTLPSGTPSHNLLCQEASAVTYNWDTDTLFIACDGGRSLTQVSKTGELIDTMTLALGSSPQGTEFYDIEGITYIGGGEFVMSEERDRQLVKFTYTAGATLERSATQTVKIGTFVDNTGTEGLTFDPLTGGFIVLKEISPLGIFQTGIDFTAGTATNGSPTTENSTNLFDPSLSGMSDFADVFAMANLPATAGKPQEGNLILLSQQDARVVNIDRSGNILSTLQIVSDPGNPLTAANQQHEGVTMDRAGNLYIVNENGGGSIDFPQLWVYAPSSAANMAPTLVEVDNAITTIAENTSTASPVKVGDIIVTDDGLGTNELSLAGPDAAFFEISGTSLFIKSGTELDFESKSSYAITIEVDDSSVGTSPDTSVAYTLTLTDLEPETPPAPVIAITEVTPWSSSTAVGADWFELTNTSTATVNITGWKMDDNSGSFGNSVALTGITSIAPGESVIFIEGDSTTVAAFKAHWFGSNPPASLQVGYYSGSGIGLSGNGDAVTLFNASGNQQARVDFGSSPSTAPFGTFDNTLAENDTILTRLSSIGSNGAFAAAASASEIGSPGFSAPGKLIVSEVAPWSSGNSPVRADWFEVTNIGARPVNIEGWKIDDSSETPADAVPLIGISSIAPGESVIFLESSTPATTITTFVSTWFGQNPPSNLQIGSYNGAGLSTGGDAVNLYDNSLPTNIRRASVSFGRSGQSAPYATFDNSAGLDVATITRLSVVGINGAHIAAMHGSETGSPGNINNPPFISPSFASWLSSNGYTSAGFGNDSDGDGLTDALEYFFNLNPNEGSGFGNLPALSDDSGNLELAFTTQMPSIGLTGKIETSANLEDWSDALSGVDYTVKSQVDTANQRSTVLTLAPAISPAGQSADYLVPNSNLTDGASTGGARVINHGLVGVGRLSGGSLDKFGETMGAASGLFITNWSYDANGERFTGTFNVLPDRGYNADGIFSNYAARLHEVDFSFVPAYGSEPVAQGQIQPVYNNVSVKFTYQDGGKTKFTTGLNVTNTATAFGQSVGVATAANGPGGAQESLLCFDAEAIHLFADGSGFVSDEYGTYIARFNAAKEITGITQLPESARPHKPAGILNFDSIAAPTTGRRNNQGLEGMSVSPDGTRLFALMQSALVQDTGAGQQGRNHTRLYVYNIEGALRETPVLIGEYVVPLPRIDTNGDNSGADKTAAQSEITAISNGQFLMLPRDGNGLGTGSANPIVYKSVQLVDFSSATNILALADAEADAISPGGVLDPSVKAAAALDVINMLDADDLAKFGLNTNTSAPDSNTLNEKMEGFGLVPDLSTPQQNDYFLFVANDNDFQSPDVKMVDVAGALVSYGDGRADAGNGKITNDAMFYAYRLTIETGGKRFYRMSVSETDVE
ncbi:lamin tail domain-containing protein [Luteolibacter algae]|uniref:Lamin tail domain-containing protein n=1 Tax=Luteolibacter algae TaxID=454151 RepID=A0ABW5D6K6_9BACT